MTLQQIGKMILGVLLLAIGIALNALAFMAIHSLERAIFYANLAILNGESITSFIRPIAGLLSGGYLKIIDSSYVYTMVVAGWILIWLGAQIIIFTKRKMPMRYLIGRKYWAVMDWEFVHKRKYRDSDLAWRKPKKKARRTENATHSASFPNSRHDCEKK